MGFQAFKDKFEHEAVVLYPNHVVDKPMVSVCVQTYQHAPFIRECLDGILMQETDFAFEILLGEDGSSDGTREICIEYAKRFPDKIRLFLHHRENNISIDGKPSGRFNFLYNLYSAKGRYIAICEGDDYWVDSHKLQKQVEFLAENNEYVGVYTNHRICDLDGRILTKRALKKDQPRYFDRKSVFGSHSSQTLTVLYKNIPEAIGQIVDFKNFANGDRVLAVMMAQYGKIKFLDFVSGAYRWGSGIHSTKLSSKKRNGRFDLFRALKMHFKEQDILISINKRLDDLYIYEIWHSLVRGKYQEARHYNIKRKQETGLPFRFPLLWKLSFNAVLSRFRNIRIL